jgi:hypothetical protein
MPERTESTPLSIFRPFSATSAAREAMPSLYSFTEEELMLKDAGEQHGDET